MNDAFVIQKRKRCFIVIASPPLDTIFKFSKWVMPDDRMYSLCAALNNKGNVFASAAFVIESAKVTKAFERFSELVIWTFALSISSFGPSNVLFSSLICLWSDSLVSLFCWVSFRLASFFFSSAILSIVGFISLVFLLTIWILILSIVFSRYCFILRFSVKQVIMLIVRLNWSWI